MTRTFMALLALAATVAPPACDRAGGVVLEGDSIR
jgi:hypothetical protein